MQRRHLTRDEMIRAIGMLEAGAIQNVVAETLGTSQNVISRLWSRYRDTGEVAERHAGRIRVTTPREDRFLQNTARREPTLTAMEMVQRLQQEHQLLVSDQTARRRLHEANLHSRRPIRVPALRRGNRGRRLLWAQEHVLWDNEQWSTVLFTDESRFGFHPDSRRTRVWRVPGRESRLQHPQEVHSYQAGTIMVWAGIRIGARTDLVFVRGNMNAQKYRDEVVEPVIIPHRVQIGQQFVLMHDNARPHTARLVSSALQDNDVTVMRWPAQSPDMNPIEHAWDMLQRRAMHALPPNLATEEQLFLHLQRTWERIPQQDIDTLIHSMNNRCQTLINVRGGNTDY